MPIPRYVSDPFQEIRRELDEVFERFAGEGFFPRAAERPERTTISPMVDISAEGETLRVEMDLPGVDPSDVECTLAEDMLAIKGERRRPAVEGETGRLQERTFGRFERRIPMPDNVDEDSLEARFDRGVLTITARLQRGAGQPRHIRIAGAGEKVGGGPQQMQVPQGQSAQAHGTQSAPQQTSPQQTPPKGQQS